MIILFFDQVHIHAIRDGSNFCDLTILRGKGVSHVVFQ